MGIDTTPFTDRETAVVPVEARLTALRTILERLFDELDELARLGFDSDPRQQRERLERLLDLAGAALDLAPPI
jgi:hypothetical protein